MSTAKAWRWSSDGTMEPGPVLPEPDTACSEVLGCFVQRVLVVGHNENFAADEQPIHSHMRLAKSSTQLRLASYP